MLVSPKRFGAPDGLHLRTPRNDIDTHRLPEMLKELHHHRENMARLRSALAQLVRFQTVDVQFARTSVERPKLRGSCTTQNRISKPQLRQYVN